MNVFGIKIGQRYIERPLIFYMEGFQETIPIDFYFWVIQDQGETILVDTGFTEAEGKKRGVTDYRHPIAQLKKLGIEAESIEKVIITHFHWDHFNGYSFFPSARFTAQKTEVEFVDHYIPHHPAITKVYNNISKDLAALKKQNRLEVIDGKYHILPRILLERVGGHTPGLQAVTIYTESKPIRLYGDVMYYQRNYLEKLPPMLNLNIPETLDVYDRMDTEEEIIIPGHDPDLIRRFPQVEEGIIQII